MVLDPAEVEYDIKDPSKLDNWAKLGLHGRIYDRWFDKSISLIVFRNGHCASNIEHSYADAPVCFISISGSSLCNLKEIDFVFKSKSECPLA